MTFHNEAVARDRKFRDESQAFEPAIDASIVLFAPEVPMLDKCWIVVLDPCAYEPFDIAEPIIVEDFVDDDDDDQDGEAE